MSGPQQTLASLLETAFGGVDAAKAAIARALAESGRDELPTSGPELLAFVRAHLLTPLSENLGPRLTMALVDDLVDELDPPAAASAPQPPSSSSTLARPVARIAMHPQSPPRGATPRLGILLVDADHIGRPTVARALLRAQWNVTLVDSVDDLAAVINAGDVVDAMLVDTTHSAALSILELLVRHRPDTAVVARGPNAARARALLTQAGAARVDVRSREASPEELIDALRALAAG